MRNVRTVTEDENVAPTSFAIEEMFNTIIQNQKTMSRLVVTLEHKMKHT